MEGGRHVVGGFDATVVAQHSEVLTSGTCLEKYGLVVEGLHDFGIVEPNDAQNGSTLSVTVKSTRARSNEFWFKKVELLSRSSGLRRPLPPWVVSFDMILHLTYRHLGTLSTGVSSIQTWC